MNVNSFHISYQNFDRELTKIGYDSSNQSVSKVRGIKKCHCFWDIIAIHRSTKVSLTVKKKIVNMIAKKKLVQHVYTFKSRGHFCSCT